MCLTTRAIKAKAVQLDRLARATGRFGDLARVFEDLASQIEDPTLASALTMMAARVHENDLGNIDTAIGLYRSRRPIVVFRRPKAEAILDANA